MLQLVLPIRIQYPSSLSELLEADNTHRLQLKFQLKDKSNGASVKVHQAFLVFIEKQSKQEFIFVVEQDSSSNYKVDLNLQTRSKDLNNLSGRYSLNLIIGDALIVNSFQWKLADIDLHLSSTKAQGLSDKKNEFLPKPEISHLFREQDKRPPLSVSNFFTFLVATPLLALVYLVSPFY